MDPNCVDAELDDHVMEVVQQTQTIVEDVQAGADSMQECERLVAEVALSASGDSPATPEMDDGATGPNDTPLDVVQDLNLTDVLLSCHPLYVGASVTKLAATMHVDHDHLHNARGEQQICGQNVVLAAQIHIARTEFFAHEYVPCEGARGESRPQLREHTRLQEWMCVI
jgi:hypothetical protein